MIGCSSRQDLYHVVVSFHLVVGESVIYHVDQIASPNCECDCDCSSVKTMKRSTRREQSSTMMLALNECSKQHSSINLAHSIALELRSACLWSKHSAVYLHLSSNVRHLGLMAQYIFLLSTAKHFPTCSKTLLLQSLVLFLDEHRDDIDSRKSCAFILHIKSKEYLCRNMASRVSTACMM